MEMTYGDALVTIKSKISSAESKLRALTIVFNAEPKSVYGKLSKNDLWELSKYLYEGLLKGYGDVEISVDNPCYHCYLGAIDKCKGCDFSREKWSKDLEKPVYKRKVHFKNLIDRIIDGELTEEDSI